MTQIERLKMQLKKLGLKTMANIFEEEAEKAAKTNMSYTGFLARLVEEEMVSKAERSINAKIAKAKFPCIKTLESFDFSFQPTLPATRVKELAQLGFLDRAENVIFVGPSGTGKTHLAISLGVKACMARKRVLFTTVSALLDQLAASTVDKSLGHRLEALSRLDLVIADELGYMPIDPQKANLFFQFVSARYEKGSIILTTNQQFDRWVFLQQTNSSTVGAIFLAMTLLLLLY